MSDIVERLRTWKSTVGSERAVEVDCIQAADEIERLREELQDYQDRSFKERHDLRTSNAKLLSLVKCLLDNDPDDDAADGATVLMVWRKEASAAVTKAEGIEAEK